MAGDREALESVVADVHTVVYNLAVRMLWCPDDAADATQEILMKVVTRLASFRGESAFQTWVFRIAVNHLLDVRRSRAENEGLTFTSFGESLSSGASDPPAGWGSDPEQRLLVEEVKIGCTTAMLLCLSRDERVAYLLGDTFELESSDAATIVGITATAFRKRLARARARLRRFMAAHCGLINAEAPCRCERRLAAAQATGRVRPGQLRFASVGEGVPDSNRRLRILDVERPVEEMEELQRIAAVFRSHPEYEPPAKLRDAVREVLASTRYSILA